MNAVSADAPEELQVVTSFCNSAVLLHGTDELQTVAAANAWLRQNRWDAIDSDAELAGLRHAREVIRDFLSDRSDAVARHAMNRLLQQHCSAPRIDAAGRLALTPASVSVTPVGAAVEAILLHALDTSGQRLKTCASAACRFVFYDRSRSRTRSWCDMNVCGARHKMRQYRQRLEPPPG